MKLLKNRKIAILITIVVAIVATLLGVRGSLNRLAGNVNDMFFNDVVIGGQTYPSVNSFLSSRENSALGLATLLERYNGLQSEAESLLSARRSLVGTNNIAEKNTANEAMQKAFTSLVKKAETLDLPDRDRNAMETYAASFSGAQTAISGSMYNKKVATFWDDVSFIAWCLRPLLFIRTPQVFG